MFQNKIFYTCISCFWLRNYNWNAMKRHRQWNVTSSHSQDVVIKVTDTLRVQIVKKYIPPVNNFLFIFKTKLLLIKVVHESFSFVSNNICKTYNSNTFKQRKRTPNVASDLFIYKKCGAIWFARFRLLWLAAIFKRNISYENLKIC